MPKYLAQPIANKILKSLGMPSGTSHFSIHFPVNGPIYLESKMFLDSVKHADVFNALNSISEPKKQEESQQVFNSIKILKDSILEESERRAIAAVSREIAKGGKFLGIFKRF